MKKVLITGGSSGIGKAAAELFLNKGFKVVATGRDSQKLQKLHEAHGGRPLICEVCDGQDFSAIKALFSRHSDLDILINNAGAYKKTDWLHALEDEYEELFGVNVKAVFHHCQEAIRCFQGQNRKGLILNVSSTLGNKPAPGTALYSASKAALQSLTKSIAMEFAPDIRANSVLPGVIDTPIHARAMGEDAAAAFRKDAAGFHPMRRIGTSNEVAQLLYYLCSEEASWITGSEFVIDGGISLVS